MPGKILLNTAVFGEFNLEPATFQISYEWILKDEYGKF